MRINSIHVLLERLFDHFGDTLGDMVMPHPAGFGNEPFLQIAPSSSVLPTLVADDLRVVGWVVCLVGEREFTTTITADWVRANLYHADTPDSQLTAG